MFSQASVNHCVHNRPRSYSVIAHPCYGVVGTHPTGMLSCKLMLRPQMRKNCRHIPLKNFQDYFKNPT